MPTPHIYQTPEPNEDYPSPFYAPAVRGGAGSYRATGQPTLWNSHSNVLNNTGLKPGSPWPAKRASKPAAGNALMLFPALYPYSRARGGLPPRKPPIYALAWLPLS